MDSILNFVLVSAVLVFLIASLWYLFQTIRVMWRYNFLIAIAAIFFIPIIHIIFYFLVRNGLDSYERGVFKKYVLSIEAIIVLGVAASVVIPAIESQNLIHTMGEENSEIDEDSQSEPWDWDIRAEGLE